MGKQSSTNQNAVIEMPWSTKRTLEKITQVSQHIDTQTEQESKSQPQKKKLNVKYS